MLKLRIIPTLLYKNMTLVKGVGFDSWRRVGSVIQAIKVYNMRMVDELIFVDITATRENRKPDFELVDDFADECFMPLTVGGGVNDIEDVRRLLQVGADKVAINSSAITNPGLVKEAACEFGSQCVVISIDCKKNNGKYEVYSHSGTQPTGLDMVEHAVEMEISGAGEILLTSIELDGTMKGYDLEMIDQVVKAVNIPVIASGGAGNYEHMYELVSKTNVDALASASIYHFTEQTPLEAKLFLKKKGINVRL
ncbi:MAG: imidazole glycerol phosphate synthase subunit HisF [Desulfobacterales bacterium]|nr:imidazole glycerol phosphate synthase subunit HisF [Desulfobacterales bacterium]